MKTCNEVERRNKAYEKAFNDGFESCAKHVITLINDGLSLEAIEEMMKEAAKSE